MNLFWIVNSLNLSSEKEISCNFYLFQKVFLPFPNSIKAKLVDAMTQEPVINQNKVLVQVSMQTWEIPSNAILRNKTGIFLNHKIKSNPFPNR